MYAVEHVEGGLRAMLVWKMMGEVGLSLPLWGVLDLAGMLLRRDLEGDARVCGTPRAQQSRRALGEMSRAAGAAQPLHVQPVAIPVV